jgi:hypothetical protein
LDLIIVFISITKEIITILKIIKMANGSKVFVSPGVYTSEKDLSFVAQSVGVTTLGLVGEALKGPAFEPIFISSYDDYVTRLVEHLHKHMWTHKSQNTKWGIYQNLI